MLLKQNCNNKSRLIYLPEISLNPLLEAADAEREQEKTIILVTEFKSLLTVERYLNLDMPFHLRKAFARFRSSSHKLAIEIGRHHNINRTDRICTFCFNQSNNLHLEDEFHVFFNCLRFDAIRQNLLSPWYRQGSSKQDFFNLMETENSDIILKTCIYINEILKIKDKEYDILAPIT